MNNDDRQQILKRHGVALREHFDTVLILAGRTDADGSCRYEGCEGSWFERLGLARAFVVRMEEDERQRVLPDQEDL